MKLLKRTTTLIITMLISFSTIANHHEPVVIGEVEMAEDTKSAAFNQILKKIGKWEGKMTQGLTGAVFDVSYEWKLTSGGNTITETIIEDGVEMLTTYSDKDGELVIKHYCALGTEPVFKVSEASDSVVVVNLDKSASDLHVDHHSFVNSMKWTMNSKNTMIFENVVNLDGEPTNNKAKLKKVY